MLATSCQARRSLSRLQEVQTDRQHGGLYVITDCTRFAKCDTKCGLSSSRNAAQDPVYCAAVRLFKHAREASSLLPSAAGQGEAQVVRFSARLRCLTSKGPTAPRSFVAPGYSPSAGPHGTSC